MPSLPGTRPLGAALRLGRGVETRSRRVVLSSARWAVLSSVGATLSAADAALASELAAEVFRRIAASDAATKLQPMILQVVESAETEQLIVQVLNSRAARVATEQLLEGEALWDLVDAIAQSPSVSRAISQQGVTFADQMVGVARTRSRVADDRLERIARRLTGRGKREFGDESDEPPLGQPLPAG